MYTVKNTEGWEWTYVDFDYLASRNNIDKPTRFWTIPNRYCFMNTNDETHRKNRPALVENNILIFHFYGVRHNLHGPSFIQYDVPWRGSMVKNTYFINGYKYTKDEWESRRLKYLPQDI